MCVVYLVLFTHNLLSCTLLEITFRSPDMIVVIPFLPFSAKAGGRSRDIGQDSNCSSDGLAGCRTQLPAGGQDDDAAEGDGEVRIR